MWSWVTGVTLILGWVDFSKTRWCGFILANVSLFALRTLQHSVFSKLLSCYRVCGVALCFCSLPSAFLSAGIWVCFNIVFVLGFICIYICTSNCFCIHAKCICILPTCIGHPWNRPTTLWLSSFTPKKTCNMGGGTKCKTYPKMNLKCILKTNFWQHKIDIKDFLRAEMSQIEGKIV